MYVVNIYCDETHLSQRRTPEKPKPRLPIFSSRLIDTGKSAPRSVSRGKAERGRSAEAAKRNKVASRFVGMRKNRRCALTQRGAATVGTVQAPLIEALFSPAHFHLRMRQRAIIAAATTAATAAATKRTR